ncbi:MAG TPA: DUF4388 domain-containing protein [Pyrinomonadaceae bacterium]|nr:DUF4388 domain-containing protein [Pyrinomonadaceae bacterium]
MGISGNLSTMHVSDLLQFMASGRKTGMLKFDRGKIVKEIYFDKGLIIGSHTNDPKEYLGQLLIHYGKLDEAKLRTALQVQRDSGGRLGEILIATRVLTEAEVAEILRIRTLDIIYDLFIWEEAHFELHDNASPPPYFIRISVEPTKVIMDGAYRTDEWKRFRTLIPSDRSVLELQPGWTTALDISKELRQILFFVEKNMSVAEICYNMHAAPFHVYGQLYELVKEGIAHVTGEVPDAFSPVVDVIDLPDRLAELLAGARVQLKEGDAEAALATIQGILEKQPKNTEARSLLPLAEETLINQLYRDQLLPDSVPKLLIPADTLSQQQLEPQEGFLLSRINDEWDIKSILSICPFREVDCLRMLKNLADRRIIGFES